MLIACELAFSDSEIAKYRLKIPYRNDVLMQKINNDLRYLIQFLDVRFNDLWLFPLLKKTLSNQFNDTCMKMAAEVKLISASNMHQRRQLCCVKREDLVIDKIGLLFMIPF